MANLPINIRLDQWAALRSYFLNNHATVIAASNYARSLRLFMSIGGGLDVARWRTSKALAGGRAALAQLVAGYALTVPATQWYTDRRIFTRAPARLPIHLPGSAPNPPGGSPGDSPYSQPYTQPALDAVWLFATVLVGSPMSPALDVNSGMRLAFGSDPASATFRSALLGQPWPGDPIDPNAGFTPPTFGGPGTFPPFQGIPPEDQIPFGNLNQVNCYGALSDALIQLETVGAQFRPTIAYPGMSISAITPRTACAGSRIHITGTGFGTTQPADAKIVFGSMAATVVPGTWTPTGFDVIVPGDTGECCISILQISQQSGSSTFASAVGNLAGVLTDCFGVTGIAAGDKLNSIGGRIPDSQSATCAVDGSNRFVGGVPRITIFKTAAGSLSPQTLHPGQTIALEWSISNATSASLTITPVGTNAALATLPSLPSWFVADPAHGSITLPAAFGLTPWKAMFTLLANNMCGTSNASLEVDFSPGLGLVFVGGGARSAFHYGAVQALGLMLPDGPAVCSGTGLGGLSAVCTAADYPNPATLRTFWDGSIQSDSWFVEAPALSVPGGDFAALLAAMYQAEARGEVITLGALDLQRMYIFPTGKNDPRLPSNLFMMAASQTADKIADSVGQGVSDALQAAGQTILSYVPIVAIVYAAAKYGITAYLDSLKQQTITAVGTTPSVFDNSRLVTLIAAAVSGVEARISVSGRKVRIPVTSLELGRARYGTEASTVSDAPVGSNIVALQPSLASIVLASATVPLLGPPVKLGTDNYVDGSLRDPVPIGATIEAGAATVIVIQPNIRQIPFFQSFDTAGMPSIDVRSGIARDAQFLDAALQPFGHFAPDFNTGVPVGQWRAPVIVVEPTVEVLGLGASDQLIGVVNIMADYGYMRCFDTVAPQIMFPDPTDPMQAASRAQLTASLSTSTDAIIGLRIAAWESEHEFNGMRASPRGATQLIQGGPLIATPDPTAIDVIRQLKTQIHDALVARLALVPSTYPVAPVPAPAAQQWYLNFEAYSFQQIVSPTTVMVNEPNGDPWVSLEYGGAWTVPAATPPAKIWP